jgi:hypothetical protein
MDQQPISSYPLSPEFAGLLRRETLLAPSPYLFVGEDVLQVDTFGSIANVVLTVSGAMLGNGLQLVPFSFTVVPSSNRTIVTNRVSLDSGWLQHIRVAVTSGTVIAGQVFVNLRFARGLTSNALLLGTIASGYVTTNTDLYWPGLTLLGPLDGVGAIRSITGTTPGAGAEISETTPTAARWEVLAVQFKLTASATVANRVVTLNFDDGVNVFATFGASDVQTAGQALTWQAAAGVGRFAAPTALVVVLSLSNGLRMLAGYRMRTVTTALQVGDQYTAPQYLVREWLEPG